MAQNAWAPAMDRMDPETLIRSLDMRTSLSAALLPNGTDGAAIHGGSIVAGHDGNADTAPNTIVAMPEIVRYMNAHHLGATDIIPADATGGDLPPIYTSLNSGTA